MAQSIEIKGTTTISTDAVAPATFVAIGITDHDDTVGVEVTNHEFPIFTNESGPNMPAKILNMGLSGKVTMNLVEWDAVQLKSLVEATSDVAAEGQIGVIGSDKKTFALKVSGNVTGSRVYTFPFCRLVDPWSEIEWGNKDSRISLSIDCYPDPDALSTATTPLYTITAVGG